MIEFLAYNDVGAAGLIAAVVSVSSGQVLVDTSSASQVFRAI